MDLLDDLTELIISIAEEIAEKIRDKYIKNPSPRLRTWYAKKPKAICAILHVLISSLGKIIAALFFVVFFSLLLVIACAFVLLLSLLIDWIAHIF